MVGLDIMGPAPYCVTNDQREGDSMEKQSMTVEVTNDQRHTIERLGVLLDVREPVFHGYASRGINREQGQEDAVWMTYGGFYVLVQTNGDIERDVLMDFLDLTDAEIDEVMQPGSTSGMVRG